MYTMLEQVTELNLMVVASSYRKIAPGVRKVVLIGGWYQLWYCTKLVTTKHNWALITQRLAAPCLCAGAFKTVHNWAHG